MLRLLAVPALLLAAGCSDPAPADAAPPAAGVGVQSNESPDELAPERSDPAAVDTTLSPTVTVAGRTVPRRAFVRDVALEVEACTLTLVSDAGGEETVLGDASLCSGQGILGERVQIEYAADVVPAASCGADPSCLETETVPFAVAVDVIGRR